MSGKLLDKAVLKTLVPPQSLNHENFQELAQKAVIETVLAGRDVFKKGDMDLIFWLRPRSWRRK